MTFKKQMSMVNWFYSCNRFKKKKKKAFFYSLLTLKTSLNTSKLSPLPIIAKIT